MAMPLMKCNWVIALVGCLGAAQIVFRSGPVCAAAEVIAPESRTELVKFVATGTGPQNVGLVSCADCDECAAGPAFVVSDTTIAFYDFTRNELELFDTGRALPAVAARIPGIPLRPFDGTGAPDGTLILAADRFANGLPASAGPRFVVYVRSYADTSWHVLAQVEPDGLASRNGIPGRDRSLRVSLRQDGAVFLY